MVCGRSASLGLRVEGFSPSGFIGFLGLRGSEFQEASFEFGRSYERVVRALAQVRTHAYIATGKDNSKSSVGSIYVRNSKL